MKKNLFVFLIFIYAGIISYSVNLKAEISSKDLSRMQSIRKNEVNTNIDGLISEIMEYAEFKNFLLVLTV